MNYRILFLTIVSLFIFSASGFTQTMLVQNLSEFNSTVQNASPGDTIALKNGVWTDTVLNFYADGTAENPIILTAETAGEVTLTGSSRLEIFGTYLEVHNLDFSNGELNDNGVVEFRKDSDELAENCRLTNCRIIDYNPSSTETNYKWVSMYGKNNRVDHCHFSGKHHQGALLTVWLSGVANHHRIDHNYFSDIPDLGENGGETIRIGTSTNSMTESRTIVEHNLFEACDGEIEIISNKSGFNIYRYNTFRNNDGVLTLRHGNDCEVYNNFFFGGPGKNSGGVRIIGERHKVYNNYFQDLEGSGTRAAICMMNGVVNSPLNRYFQVTDVEVVHNTIVSCKQAFAIGEGSNDELTLPPIDCRIANNVADDIYGNDPLEYVDPPINMSYTSNYIFAEDLDISDDGIINSDPGLTLTDGLWRPDASSPITNAATLTFDYVSTDMDEQPRTDTPDLGSDEVSGASITNVPLNPEDVGFNWQDEALNIRNIDVISPVVFVENNTLRVTHLPQEYVPYTLTIYDIQGKEVQSHRISSSEVSLPLKNLKGTYTVHILGKGNVHEAIKIVL